MERSAGRWTPSLSGGERYGALDGWNDGCLPGTHTDHCCSSTISRYNRQMKAILAICIPNWRSAEAGLLASHTFFLILRTYLSVVVADLDGRIVRDLVRFLLRAAGHHVK